MAGVKLWDGRMGNAMNDMGGGQQGGLLDERRTMPRHSDQSQFSPAAKGRRERERERERESRKPRASGLSA